MLRYFVYAQYWLAQHDMRYFVTSSAVERLLFTTIEFSTALELTSLDCAPCPLAGEDLTMIVIPHLMRNPRFIK